MVAHYTHHACHCVSLNPCSVGMSTSVEHCLVMFQFASVHFKRKDAKAAPQILVIRAPNACWSSQNAMAAYHTHHACDRPRDRAVCWAGCNRQQMSFRFALIRKASSLNRSEGQTAADETNST
jgi:hypothetical protein